MGEPTAILARSHQVIELNSEFSSYQADKPEHTYVWMKLLGPNSEVSQFHGKLPNHYLAALVAGVNKFSIGLITRYEYRFDDATYDEFFNEALKILGVQNPESVSRDFDTSAAKTTEIGKSLLERAKKINEDLERCSESSDQLLIKHSLKYLVEEYSSISDRLNDMIAGVVGGENVDPMIQAVSEDEDILVIEREIERVTIYESISATDGSAIKEQLSLFLDRLTQKFMSVL